MKFLFFDSSSMRLLLAARNGDIASVGYLVCANKHGSVLVPAIGRVLEQVSLEAGELDFLACGIGPGSLTGVRIGLSTAKGLCYPYETQLLPMCSLDLVASRNSHKKRVVVRKARAGYYYWRSYEPSEEGTIIPASEPAFDSIETISMILKDNDCILLFDDHEAPEDFASFTKLQAFSPSAETLFSIIDRELESVQPKPFREVNPLYLQRSLAEDNWEKRHGS